MSALPTWLEQIKRTLPGWIERLAHSDGPGRYRFAVDAYEPYDLDSSCLVQNIMATTGIGGILPDDALRQAWIDYLLGLQRPADGLLIDEGMERHIVCEGDEPTDEERFTARRWTSRNGLTTVIEMGGQPRYRLQHDEAFETPEQIVAYMEGLDWSNPWSAGSWAGAVVFFQHFNRLLGDAKAEAIIRAGVDWLATRQDPKTGAWTDGSETPLNVLINGIFKVWIQAIPRTGLPVQYPDRVIDLCVRGMRESPALSKQADACSIFDVALVLDTALRFTEHRRDEVAELAAAYLPKYEPFCRPDGALSYGADGSLAVHGKLALAPVTDQSDAAGTAIHVNGLSLLCSLCGLRDELGWTPTTEWRMGL